MHPILILIVTIRGEVKKGKLTFNNVRWVSYLSSSINAKYMINQYE